MPNDPNCVFCQIIAGTIPCHRVYEDDVVLAFLDIGPLVEGHLLVIPKRHYATVMETPDAALGAVAERLPRLARALLAATSAKACHVLANNGEEAQQSVRHLHYHLLPRRHGDHFAIPWNTGKLEPAAAAKLAAGIRKNLASQ